MAKAGGFLTWTPPTAPSGALVTGAPDRMRDSRDDAGAGVFGADVQDVVAAGVGAVAGVGADQQDAAVLNAHIPEPGILGGAAAVANDGLGSGSGSLGDAGNMHEFDAWCLGALIHVAPAGL